jgi:hypothetical protein
MYMMTRILETLVTLLKATFAYMCPISGTSTYWVEGGWKGEGLVHELQFTVGSSAETDRNLNVRLYDRTL